MSLLYHNEGDLRLVPFLQLSAGGPDGEQLLGENNQELEQEGVSKYE